MFFKKEEKQEMQNTNNQAETQTVSKVKVIYKIVDGSGQGDWTIVSGEVSKEHELGANEFPKILAAQKAVYKDISIRLQKLKAVRAKVKAVRKAEFSSSKE